MWPHVLHMDGKEERRMEGKRGGWRREEENMQLGALSADEFISHALSKFDFTVGMI